MTSIEYSIINTGVYPEKHDIIGDSFYDPNGHVGQGSRRKFFNHQDERMTKDARWWNKVEPVWATAQKAGLRFITLLWGRYTDSQRHNLTETQSLILSFSVYL